MKKKIIFGELGVCCDIPASPAYTQLRCCQHTIASVQISISTRTSMCVSVCGHNGKVEYLLYECNDVITHGPIRTWIHSKKYASQQRRQHRFHHVLAFASAQTRIHTQAGTCLRTQVGYAGSPSSHTHRQ